MTHQYWRQIALARHEAAHCIAAQWMDLKVPWVSIEGGKLSSGGDYTAGCALDMEDADDLNVLAVDANIPADKLLGVCVSMSMPSFTTTTTDPFYEYSIDEYRQALQIAEKGGISEEEIDWRCEQIKDEKWTEILDLANRLMEEGRVEFIPA